MGTNSGAEPAYSSGEPEFTPGFMCGSCYSIFSLMCMFCKSLFVPLCFFFWQLCCLFFFDLRILIIPLVSSNYSYLNVSIGSVEVTLSLITQGYWNIDNKINGLLIGYNVVCLNM